MGGSYAAGGAGIFKLSCNAFANSSSLSDFLPFGFLAASARESAIARSRSSVLSLPDLR